MTRKRVGPTERLHPEADFHDFAAATVDVAGELYGRGGRIQRILAGAWGDVGIDVPGVPCEHPSRLERRRRLRHHHSSINHTRRSSS